MRALSHLLTTYGPSSPNGGLSASISLSMFGSISGQSDASSEQEDNHSTALHTIHHQLPDMTSEQEKNRSNASRTIDDQQPDMLATTPAEKGKEKSMLVGVGYGRSWIDQWRPGP